MEQFIKSVTMKPCGKDYTEPKKDQQDAFSFDVAYEKGNNRLKTYEEKNAQRERQQEPVFVVNR